MHVELNLLNILHDNIKVASDKNYFFTITIITKISLAQTFNIISFNKRDSIYRTILQHKQAKDFEQYILI